MIEHLEGNYETVTFKDNLSIRIHDNRGSEDFPPHWHNPLEMIQVIDNGYLVLASEQEIQLAEGDVAFIMPGTIHTLISPKEGFRRIYLADISLIREVPEMEATLSLLPGLLVISKNKQPSVHRQISLLLAGIREEYGSDNSLCEPLILSRLLELFVLLCRNELQGGSQPETTQGRHPRYSERLLSICSFIGAHCTEDLTLDDAASLAGFSKYHFSRLFKEVVHMSFYQYLSQKRISHAEQLLTHPEYSVTEVALQSGFTSLSSFIRMFKLQKGCTPTQFRDMYSSDWITTHSFLQQPS